MIASILTTIFFALSAIFGKRTADLFGGIAGNFWRLTIATGFLALITLAIDPDSFAKPTFRWFFISGIVGFGIGDIGLFLAYPRLGSRLTILINLCLAPVFGALAEYFWLGTTISPSEASAALLILIGVGLALIPRRGTTRPHGHALAGALLATLAGFGQGFGAVISRHAESLSSEIAIEISGTSAAFQRILGGLIIALIAHLVMQARRRKPAIPPSGLSMGRALGWVSGAALFGPVIGVSCFQWALKDTPSAIVLAIVATTPIVLIPLAALFEKDHPTGKSIAGAVLAVTGVVWICLLR